MSNNNDNKQPAHIIVFKVLVFFIFPTVPLIAKIVLSKLAVNNVEIFTNLKLFGIMISVTCLVLALGLVPVAFSPEFRKMKWKKDQYIQRQTETLQEDFAARDSDIHYRATKKRSRAFIDGLTYERCPFCGDDVAGDEQFCNKCGKALYIKCKSCKTVNMGDSKFCKKCGKDLQ